MANTLSGSEGKVRIGAAGSSSGTIGTLLRIGNWKLGSDPGVEKDTSALDGGHHHRSPTCQDDVLTGKVYCRGSDLPGDLAVYDGASFDVDLKVGSGTMGYHDWEFIFGNIEMQGCTQDGFVEWDFTAYAQEDRPALATTTATFP